MKTKITLRFGATADDVDVDGVVFTRGNYTREGKSLMRNIILSALKMDNYFPKEPQR